MANQITFRPVIARRQQHGDGSYNVKIRVTFKRCSRFLSTTITAPAKDVDKAGNLKGESLSRGWALIKKFQGYLNDLDFFLAESMTVDEVVAYLRKRGTNKRFQLDFFEFASSEILPAMTPGTAAAYQTALNSFSRYLNSSRLDINDITKTMLADFARHIDNEPKIIFDKNGPKASKVAKRKGYASALYLGKLRVIYKAAAKRYNDHDSDVVLIPRNPFADLNVTAKGGVALTAQKPEVIQKLIDFVGPCRPNTRSALDVYLISFALMGMNTKDMFECAPAKRGVIVYNRAKTRGRRWDKAEHHVKIAPQIQKLIEKYKDPTGQRQFNFYLKYKNAMAMNNAIRYSLHTLATQLGIAPFSSNAARHSWATIARSKRCGVDPATVDDCLVHMGDHRLADVYAEKDWQVFWDVNQKVLDIFDWSALTGH